METYRRINAIIITLTTLLMYGLWLLIEKADMTLIPNSQYFVPIIAALTAYGAYSMLLKIVDFTLNKLEFLKELVCGQYYLDGIWVGFYINTYNKPIYYIERYIQDYGKLNVKGRCYYEDGTYKGSWFSEDVVIDIKQERIIYNYYTDLIANNHMNQGQATFEIMREENGKKAVKLVGYSKDLFNHNKLYSLEVKLIDGHNSKINRFENESKYIQEAKRLYYNYYQNESININKGHKNLNTSSFE